MIKVYVWEPKGINVGHSSLEVNCPITNEDGYISWWPPYNGSFVKKNLGQASTYIQDVKTEKRSPDYEIEIITLDEQKVLNWWNTFLKDSESKYSLGKYNCSWAVIKGLQAGGANDYFPWHRFIHQNNFKIKIPNVQKVIWKYVNSVLNLLIKEKEASIKDKLFVPLIHIIDEYSSTWSPYDVITYVQLLDLGINGKDNLTDRLKKLSFEDILPELPLI